MEQIRFSTGSKTTYVIEAPKGTLKSILGDVGGPDWESTIGWEERAIAAFRDASSIREDFNGEGTTMQSEKRPLPEARRGYATEAVLNMIKAGYRPRRA